MKQMIPTEDVMKIGKTYVSPEPLSYESPNVYIDFKIPKKDYDAMGNNGLIVFLMNTTSVTIPFYKTKEQEAIYRFTCSAIYDEQGNSMVVRGVIFEPILEDDGENYLMSFVFDDNFTEAIVESEIAPYGVVRFITFN